MSFDRTAARAEWRDGWSLVLASAAGYSLIPLALYTVGLFVAPLEKEFGWSRAVLTSGMTMIAVTTFLFSSAVGGLIDRVGPRRVAIPGAILFCSFFALFATMGHSEVYWYGLWLLLAIASLGIKPTTWTTAISGRFQAARGLALAIALSGSGITGIMAPIISGYLIDTYGWRIGYAGTAAIWFLFAAPLVFYFFYGARDIERLRPSPSEIGRRRSPQSGVAVGRALRSRAFIGLAIATFCVMLSMPAALVHFVPLLSDLGMDRSRALEMASLLGLSAFLGRLITGSLLDRLNPKIIGGIMFGTPAVAFLLLLNFDGGTAFAVVIALLIGFTSGAELEVTSYLCARYFGLRNFGAIFGFLVGLISMATGFGPPLAGIIHDVYGSYRPALIGAIPLSLFAAVLIFTLRRPPEQEDA